MDDASFKVTLVKALEHRANVDRLFGTAKMWEVILSLPQCNLFIEETGIFSRREWDTYCSILHIQVPLDKQDSFNTKKDEIFEIAESIYGKQGNNYLTSIDIGILIEHYEVIDFSSLSLTAVISKAISDAELLMAQGRYDSAFDRIHTAFHGYMRKVLDNRSIAYDESDTLSQLYTKLHTDISSRMAPSPIADLLRTTLRSASGIVAAFNDMRNRHSLAHPNNDLLSVREAKLAINLIRIVSDYINSIV